MTVSDLERARGFYSALGLELTAEQHGNGPLHYSCVMQNTIMELYPCTKDHPPRAPLRMGFDSKAATWRGFVSENLLKTEPRLLRTSAAADVYLIRDPDGNAIELEVGTNE
ncbi:MAG TPA: hypothetical protein VGM90_37870 [Kofleriaceae bacterium]